MVDGLEEEITTVSFSLFVVGLFMTAVAILVTHSDTSSLAAILIHITASGGIFTYFGYFAATGS